MSINVSFNKITIGDTEIVPPNSVDDHIERDGSVIVAVDTYRRGKLEDRDFEFPSDDRNVVAIDHAGQISWIIEAVPAEYDYDEPRHTDLWNVQNRYLTRHTNANFEFDPETGEILEVWSKAELPIGDQIVDLSGEVFDVLEFEDAVFISCKQATHDLYAFEADGTERWRSEADERRGLLSVEDGGLWEQVAVNRTTDHRYRLDPDTGDRLDREEIDTGLW